MRKAIRFISFFLVLLLLILAGIIALPDQFGESYQRVIVPQYDYYRKMGSGKIVFIGTSCLSYGLDLDLMEELTGRPCAILGNHAGYGLSYHIEMSKCNLQSGDIVVLELALNQRVDTCGAELLLTGMGKRYDMYRFLHPAVWGQIIKAYPSFLKKSFDYLIGGGYHTEGAYSINAYDWRGNYIFPREECIIPQPFTDEVAKTYGRCVFGPVKIDEGFRQYLNDYYSYCAEKNVQVLLITTCNLDEAVISSPEEIEVYDQSIREQLDAPLISHTADHIFSRDYFYNAIRHCNDAGAELQTRLIYGDLYPYLYNLTDKEKQS